MKTALGKVFRKEIRENYRDKRTLSSALIFGPLFGPVLFVAIMTLSLTRAIGGRDKPLELPVIGAEFAPSLIAFLEQENVVPVDGVATREEALDSVRSGEIDLALVIPREFSAQLRNATPASVEVITDESDAQAAARADRARRLISAWGHQIGALRLQARGINPSIMTGVRVEETDTSTPSGRSALILGMLTYFLLFSMLMGGMYLAIDSTAGERERGSLEPLLSLPVSRRQLIVGKILAACLYMLVSLAASLAAFVIAIKFIPLEKLGMTANFGPAVAAQAFAILAPFALLGASLMTVVASFTKSYKEAQSYVTIVMLLPTVPIIIAAVMTLRPSHWLMGIPSLSQHLLVTQLIKAEPLSVRFIATSEITTLVLGGMLAWLATWLYRREEILM